MDDSWLSIETDGDGDQMKNFGQAGGPSTPVLMAQAVFLRGLGFTQGALWWDREDLFDFQGSGTVKNVWPN